MTNQHRTGESSHSALLVPASSEQSNTTHRQQKYASTQLTLTLTLAQSQSLSLSLAVFAGFSFILLLLLDSYYS
jgi:hypothetical protein